MKRIKDPSSPLNWGVTSVNWENDLWAHISDFFSISMAFTYTEKDFLSSPFVNSFYKVEINWLSSRPNDTADPKEAFFSGKT